MLLRLGGYSYFYVWSNLDNPKIEEDTFRILFLGESTTAGALLDKDDDAYPAQVEKILQQKYSDKKIKSYNKGRGSIETTAILRNLDRDMIKYKPHLVIFMAGVNDNSIVDTKVYQMNSLYLSRLKFYRLIVSIEDFFRIKKSSGENLEKGDFRYIGGPQFGYHYKPFNSLSQVIFNLNEIIRTVHSHGSEIWFAGYLQPDARRGVNPVLQKIAEENNITYVGDYPEVDFKVNRSLFAEDGWHPSEEGHKIIAEAIAERIIQEGIIDNWQSEN